MTLFEMHQPTCVEGIPSLTPREIPAIRVVNGAQYHKQKNKRGDHDAGLKSSALLWRRAGRFQLDFHALLHASPPSTQSPAALAGNDLMLVTRLHRANPGEPKRRSGSPGPASS